MFTANRHAGVACADQDVFVNVVGGIRVQETAADLPVLLAVMVGLSPQTRLYRSFFLDELGQDYVRTARAKGQSEMKILLRHALRNAAVPIVT